MTAALLRSKHALVLVLSILMIATGINALQLFAAAPAQAATSAAAAPAAPASGPDSLTCDSGFNACQASFSVGGNNPPTSDGGNSGGTISSPTGAPGAFGFLARCSYQQSVGAGTISIGGGSVPTITIYPVKLDTQAQGQAVCNAENGDRDATTSPTMPPVFHSSRNPYNYPCAAKMINGHWTAATGLYVHTNGWQKVAGSNPIRWTVVFTATCVYPTRSSWDIAHPWTRTCIMNGVFRLYYSTSASTIKSGSASGYGSGTLEDQSGTVNPRPALNQRNAINCAQDIEAKWQGYRLTQSTTYGGPLYGFYRFSTRGKFIVCEGTTPENWTGAADTSSCDPDTEFTKYLHVRYTYTCQSSGFREDASPNQSDDQYFEPAGCVNYTCHIDSTLIANQQPATAVSVLRNGEQTNTRIGNFTVTGNGLTNVSNKQVKLNVVEPSSPENPSAGVNDSNQWYRLMNQTSGSRINFNTWQNLPSSTSRLKAGLIFYWASDPGAHWQMRQAYRFDGTYYVYRQDTVNGSPYKTHINQPDKVCDDRTLSSEVTALRSINKVSN